MKNYESGLQRAYGSYKYLHQPCVGPLVLQASGLRRAFAVIFPHSAAGRPPYACDGPPVLVIRVVPKGSASVPNSVSRVTNPCDEGFLA